MENSRRGRQIVCNSPAELKHKMAQEKKEANGYAMGSWFMGFTSIGGLSQSHATDLRFAKMGWCVLFVVCMVLTIMNVEHLFQDYAASTVVTTVTQQYSDQPAFSGRHSVQPEPCALRESSRAHPHPQCNRHGQWWQRRGHSCQG